MIKTLETILIRSLYYFLIVLAFDTLLFLSLYLALGYGLAVYIFGVSVFLETAGFFLAGGIADYTESYGSVNLRSFLGKKKITYSSEKHKKNDILGASLVLAGVWFVGLAILMFLMHIQ